MVNVSKYYMLPGNSLGCPSRRCGDLILDLRSRNRPQQVVVVEEEEEEEEEEMFY